MTLSVRSATLADAPALRALFLRSRQAAFVWQAQAPFQLSDFDAQTQGERLWLAQDGMGTAGFIAVWEPEQFIHHLHVDPRRARRGVGRALLHALPGWGARPYRLKCVCRNLAALAFYRACGFAEVGRGQAEDGAYVLLESRVGGCHAGGPLFAGSDSLT
ncbi:MAG TPA: GNAT family N-acetyltransferase [Pseudorhodoferax sp.]|jgi:GNAT superfamily N-acetyltransferase|nr:GNAT family N-acetyltransferase [Pseudorhodoferax sp.]